MKELQTKKMFCNIYFATDHRYIEYHMEFEKYIHLTRRCAQSPVDLICLDTPG